MVAGNLLELHAYKKRKSRGRLLEALARFYTEVLFPANEESLLADSTEFEEFTAEILADHLIGKLNSSKDIRGMDQQYREFDQHLRRALQRKMKSRAHYESMTRF